MSHRAGAVTIGILLAFPLLSACSQAVGGTPAPVVGRIATHTTAATPTPSRRPPHILVFTVTGSNVAITSVTYGYDGHDTPGTPGPVPWRATVDIPNDGARHTYEFTLNTSGSGDVHAQGILDGTVVGDSTGSGGTTISLNGDFAG